MSRPLHEALERLRQEFPDANLRDARLEFRFGELLERNETWNKVYWQVRINNNTGSGETLDEAVSGVHEIIAREAAIPNFAKRIADILRELEYHDRYAATEAAQRILDAELRRG